LEEIRYKYREILCSCGVKNFIDDPSQKECLKCGKRLVVRRKKTEPLEAKDSNKEAVNGTEEATRMDTEI